MNCLDGIGCMHTRMHALDSVSNLARQTEQSESGSGADQGVQLTVNNLPKDLKDDRINKIRVAEVIRISE